MPRYEMYEPLGNGQKRLISLFDSETDEVTMVTNSRPVVLQQPSMRTSQQIAPVKPQKPQVRTLSRQEAAQLVLNTLNKDVPGVPDVLGEVVKRQREQGLRG